VTICRWLPERVRARRQHEATGGHLGGEQWTRGENSAEIAGKMVSERESHSDVI
jgi:hypothetical protein